MKCKVILAFGQYSVGAIIEPSGVYRQQLRARGLIQPIEPAPIEVAAVPRETATRKIRTKRLGQTA